MRDYTKYSFRITFIVVAAMLILSFIPPFSIGGVNLRRANILSDVFVFADGGQEQAGELTDTDREFLNDAGQLGVLESGNVTHVATMEQKWEIGGAEDEAGGSGVTVIGGGLAFEDYTPAEGVSVADFAEALEATSRRRTVRIAFFGDSYIEGDIITGDVREQLQEAFGGQGVGFVPMGTPQSISRPSIRHRFEGWQNYNLIYKKNVPSPYCDMFAVSGTVSVPEGGKAWSEYKGTGFRKRLWSWPRARFIFLDNAGATIDVAVNDSITKRFTPEPDEQLQQISLTGSGMRSLRIAVDAPEGGFAGYGVVLEGTRGVAVDNYAIRSNSGIAMFGTDAQMNVQLGRILGFDMIVLQWGLNAMTSGATDYKAYGSQLRRVVNYMKACYPRSTIVIMGIGDKAVQRGGEMITQEGVEAMLREQRAAAQVCGVAFWNTFEAMGGRGSMAAFVEKGWAAKDYTHLSYAGGRYIAEQFVRSLLSARGADGEGALSAGAREPESVVLDLSRATVEETEEEPPIEETATVDTDALSDSVLIEKRSLSDSLDMEPDSLWDE